MTLNNQINMYTCNAEQKKSLHESLQSECTQPRKGEVSMQRWIEEVNQKGRREDRHETQGHRIYSNSTHSNSTRSDRTHSDSTHSETTAGDSIHSYSTYN